MANHHATALLLMVVLLSAALVHSSEKKARALKDEAYITLRQGRGGVGGGAQYKAAIGKLEKALAMLEKAGSKDMALMQEIQAGLFWARKFTTLSGMPTYSHRPSDYTRTHEPDPRAPQKPAPAPAPAKPRKPVEKKPLTPAERAALAFKNAEAFEAEKKDDLFVVMIRWLQLSEQLPIQDLRQRALRKARDVQKRFEAAHGGKDDSPGKAAALALIKEADALSGQGKREAAVKLYRESLLKRETIIAHRKLGHAYYAIADAGKKKLSPQFDAAQKAYRDALKKATRGRGRRRRVNYNYPPLLDAKERTRKLQNEANKIFSTFNQASKEFDRVLELMPGGWDLDAEGHRALCTSVRGDPVWRSRARERLSMVVRKYRPLDQNDRTLLDRCKKELQRLKAEAGK